MHHALYLNYITFAKKKYITHEKKCEGEKGTTGNQERTNRHKSVVYRSAIQHPYLIRLAPVSTPQLANFTVVAKLEQTIQLTSFHGAVAEYADGQARHGNMPPARRRRFLGAGGGRGA
jgi:hypothetical protein